MCYCPQLLHPFLIPPTNQTLQVPLISCSPCHPPKCMKNDGTHLCITLSYRQRSGQWPMQSVDGEAQEGLKSSKTTKSLKYWWPRQDSLGETIYWRRESICRPSFLSGGSKHRCDISGSTAASESRRTNVRVWNEKCCFSDRNDQTCFLKVNQPRIHPRPFLHCCGFTGALWDLLNLPYDIQEDEKERGSQPSPPHTNTPHPNAQATQAGRRYF